MDADRFKKLTSKTTGKPYFFNTLTKQTFWTEAAAIKSITNSKEFLNRFKKVVSTTTGKPYFFNTRTKQTYWTEEAAMKSLIKNRGPTAATAATAATVPVTVHLPPTAPLPPTVPATVPLAPRANAPRAAAPIAAAPRAQTVLSPNDDYLAGLMRNAEYTAPTLPMVSRVTLPRIAVAQAEVAIAQPDSCSLINPDAMCYMNASIQMLYSINDFRNLILNSKTSRNPYIQALRIIFYCMINAPMSEQGHKIMSPAITKMLLEVENQPGAFVSVRAILSTITNFGEDTIGRQADASEFMIGLLNNIDYFDETNLEIKQRSYYNDNSKNRVYRYILDTIKVDEVIENTCIYGGPPMETKISSHTIIEAKRESSLDWTNPVSLQMLLFTTENNINTPESWFNGCEVPKTIGGFRTGPYKKVTSYRVPNTRTVMIYIPPYIPRRIREKNKIIDNTTVIDRISRPVILNKKIVISDTIFVLSGYILHLGYTLNGGHYIYIKCNGNGDPSMIINDSRITHVTGTEYMIPGDVIQYHNTQYQNQNTYVACYTRVNIKDPELIESTQDINRRKLELLDDQTRLTRFQTMDWKKIKGSYLNDYLRTILSALPCPSPIHKSKVGYQIKDLSNPSRPYISKIPVPSPPNPLIPYDVKNIDSYLDAIKPGDTRLADLLVQTYGFEENTTIPATCIKAVVRNETPLTKAKAEANSTRARLEPLGHHSSLGHLRMVFSVYGVIPLTDAEINRKMKEWIETQKSSDAHVNEGLVRLAAPLPQLAPDVNVNTSELSDEELLFLGLTRGGYKKTRKNKRSYKRKTRSKGKFIR